VGTGRRVGTGRLDGRVAGFLEGFLVGFGLTGALVTGAGRVAGLLVGFLVGFGLTGALVTGAFVGLAERLSLIGVLTGVLVGAGVLFPSPGI
jgi:hypothetical protein